MFEMVYRCGGRSCPGRDLDRARAVTQTPGEALPAALTEQASARFGHDFSRVRVHAGAEAAESAAYYAADAYTVGSHIVFGAGQYQPESRAGQRLLLHELTHVVQSGNGGGAGTGVSSPSDPSEREASLVAAMPWDAARRAPLPQLTPTGTALQRAETLGTKVTEPKGGRPPFKTVSGTFDGAKFRLVADGKVIVDADGQSGHPNTVAPADAKACKGAADDSYLNNVRYVGIKDKGAIPEGEYTFRHSEMVTFTGAEDAKMALAQPGSYADPSGLDLHGDWGAARAQLHPVRLLPSRSCGSTAARGGFYLHGGVMTGSSGCIDIGNTAITAVVNQLSGFTAPVHVTVRYTAPAPTVGPLDRAAGRFMYPGKDTSFFGRVKSLFGQGDQ